MSGRAASRAAGLARAASRALERLQPPALLGAAAELASTSAPAASAARGFRSVAASTSAPAAAPAARGFRSSAAAAARGDFLFDPNSPFAPRATPVNTLLRVVPQQTAFVVERFGRYSRTLTPGLHVLIPVVDRIAYTHSLKEQTLQVPGQAAITKDNVSLTIDAVLYLRVDDAYRASYGVENAVFAASQLAQTTMRSELGKISLDSVFAERDALNANVVAAIQPAAEAWGLRVLRYEIKDIVPPAGVRAAMELQAEAERRKRAEVLQSEGVRQATINRAEAGKQAVILASEAAREDQANRATGEAEAILRRAEATAAGVGLVAAALQAPGGQEAVALRVAEQYVDAFGKIAKEGTTVLLPAQAGDPAAMVAQAMSIFGRLGPGGAGAGAGGGGGNGGNGGGDAGGAGAAPAAPRPATPAPRADEGAPRPAFSLARK